MSQSGEGKSSSSSKPGSFVPPSVEELDAVLDAYDFLEILGKGGMGAVYKARQTNLDRLVAIKILPQAPDEEDELRFAERFQREAKAMGRLSHPNIIGVYDFGQTGDGQLYIVMEYVDGTDLHQLIQTGELNTEHIYGWIPQICEAMQYAHSQGIIHRDIKPANIMITREGVVKVADFGLAKLGEQDGQNTRLTMTNVAMGTPDYVAPEALEEGIEPDHRADLYAVGVMLYEMLTGKIPRGAWRPPSALKPDVDPRFDALVNRAMDADRDSRFQHASEISTHLSSIQSTPYKPQVDTPGGRKLNLVTDGTRPVRTSGSVSSDGQSSAVAKAAPSDSSSASSSRLSTAGRKKSNTAWIIGGSVAACLAIGGLIVFLVVRGMLEKPEDLGSLTEVTPEPTVQEPEVPGVPPEPEPSPEPGPEPEPQAEPAPSTTEVAMAPSDAPDAGGDSGEETEPQAESEPAAADISSHLLPVRHSLYFTGKNTGIAIPSLTGDTNQPFTAEAWIQPHHEGEHRAGILGYGKMVVQVVDGHWQFWRHFSVKGPLWKKGESSHVALVGDGSRVTLFVDGKPTVSTELPPNEVENSDQAASIGGGYGGQFRGTIDEVRFSKVARYTEEFTPDRSQDSDEQTLALYRFDHPQDGKIRDLSGNGHDIDVSDRAYLRPRATAAPPIAQAPFDGATAHTLQEEWANLYDVPVEFENSIGMRFRLLPPGRFLKGEGNNSDTEIPRPYYAGVHEVTQGEFEEIMGENPSSFRKGGAEAEAVAGLDTRAHPAERLHLIDAINFCNRLSEREGLTPAYRTDPSPLSFVEGANGYRLPTSEEWEFACRAGTTTPYLDGQDNLDNSSLERFARGGDRTYPVGEKLPNAFGLHDIQGNVCEWVNGKYGSDWTVSEPVTRYGGFRRNRSNASWASWMQAASTDSHRSYDIGFRIVLPSLTAVAELPKDREIKRVTPPHPATEQLRQLESAIREAYSTDVDSAYQESLRKLNDQFRNALSQRAAGAQGQAQVAFQAELDRITHGAPMPDSDEGLPPAIVQLRRTWRSQEAGFSAARDSARTPFWKVATAKLAQAIQEFEKDGLTYFALQAEDLQRRLQSELMGEAPSEPLDVTTVTSGTPAAAPVEPNAQWIPLFDSRSLNGWEATGSPRSFSVDRDAIKVSGEPGFLYYSGPAFFGARFRDFDFRAQVKTEGGANSGIFFHTSSAGTTGFPSQGYEVQIHNGSQDPEKTGSLVGITPTKGEGIPEGEWFDLEIQVRGKSITTLVNGEIAMQHVQPNGWQPPQDYPGRAIYEGTFAIQSHFPAEGITWLREIQVRPYRDAFTMEVGVSGSDVFQREPRKISALPKGRLHAFGVDKDGNPFTLGELDRGNDYVDIDLKPGNWVALRARGGLVSPDNYWNAYADHRIAAIDFGSSGETPILYQDGTLRGHGKEPVQLLGVDPQPFVDLAGGYNSWSGLSRDGQIFAGIPPSHSTRPPPLGPTDIIKIERWHSTIWCLRANGQVTWCGSEPLYNTALPSDLANHRIVDLDAEAQGLSLALSDQGEVFLWTSQDVPAGMEVPEEHRTGVSQVRAGWGGKIAAVRKKNGKWHAWGSDKFGVVSKINSLGPEVVGMAFTESQLIWIE